MGSTVLGTILTLNTAGTGMTQISPHLSLVALAGVMEAIHAKTT
jgi:hypothetical protein